jgi:hypothetical protein
MTISELVAAVQIMEPDHDVFVALFQADGTGAVFDIEDITDHDGHAQLNVYQDEVVPEETGNGAVTLEVTEGASGVAEAAVDAFLALCERRGITEEEKDLIWNAMAFLCYEQVQNRHGPFYEAMRPFLAEGEE